MWYLVCRNKDGQSYRLTKDKSHSVSRTKGDITLVGDQSISRSHAIIEISPGVNNPQDDNSGVKITDLGSKYGTFVNGTLKLEPQKPHWLQDGDVVTFGCQWNEWRLHAKPLVVTTSTLPNAQKEKVKELISALGGTVVNEWQDSCSHLTMAEISLTAKTVCALASAVPIVSPHYWTCFKEALDQHKIPPDAENFIPPLKESILNKNKVSFSVNQNRRKVFQGKTFIFSSERQLKKYKVLVQAAGGTCKSIAEFDKKLNEFCKPNIILMQNLSTIDSQHSQPSDVYHTALNLMRSNGLKPIPESDIGLAILMCSMDMYCNPKYDVVENVLEGRASSSSQMMGGEVWAFETPNSTNDMCSIKTENEEADERRIDPTPSNAGSSIPHSYGDSGSMYDSRNLDETLPCDMDGSESRDLNPIGEEASPSPAVVSTRKRAVPAELDGPPAKIAPLQSRSLSDEAKSPPTLFDDYDFCSVITTKTTSLNRASIRKHSETSSSSVNETPKRKTDDSCQNGNLSKKPCLEVASTPGVPRSIRQTPGTFREKVSPLLELGENLNALTVDSPLNDRRRPSNSGSSLDMGSSSSNGRSSKNSVEELDGVHQGSKIKGWSLASGSNGVLSGKTETLDEARPSTSSKSVSCDAAGSEIGRKPKDSDAVGVGGWMLVKGRNLIVERRSNEENEPTSCDASVVNFKKFRKVRSAGSSATSLPIIIGDSDLEVFKENALL